MGIYRHLMAAISWDESTVLINVLCLIKEFEMGANLLEFIDIISHFWR